MKKLLAIFMLCFAVFAAKAQIFLLQESFDESTMPSGWTSIDADGDGFDWVPSLSVGSFTTHTGDGCIASASYDNPSYTALTPDNWLITPAITIPADASEPTLSWWVTGQDGTSYYAEYYGVFVSTTGTSVSDFGTTALYEETVSTSRDYLQRTVDLSTYAGQTIYIAFRHYNCTDMFYIDIDDIEVSCIPTEPTMTVNPTSLNFGTVIVGQTVSRTANVSAFNLTDAITVSTAAPFAVSLDGETFATTVSMPAAGGTLYVQYAPTAAINDNGTVTLTNGDLTATITVAGIGFECTTVTDFPYETNFSNTAMNDCWTIENANNDDKTFTIDPSSSYAYYAYSQTSNADDWLISPTFTLTGNEYLTFDYRAASSTYAEKFEVAVIQGATRTVIVPEITVTNTSFQTIDIVDLSAYTGDYQIGIHCVSDTDRYRFYVTNFKVAEAIPSLTLSEEDIDFGTVIVNETADEEVLVSTMLVTDAVEVSTSAPFAVSLDGTTFAATATIPATTDMANTTTVYVRFAPTAAEEYAGTVIFTAGSLTDTVFVAGNGFECTTVTEFPYQTDFSNEAMNLCWTIEDVNNDNKTFTLVPSSSYAQYTYNTSSAADDWLISPVMALTGNEFVRFDYKTGSSWDEKFEVAIIQGSTRTIVVPEMTVRTSDYLTLDPVVLTAYTGEYQIGIHCTSAADMFRLYITNFVVDDISNLDTTLTVNPEAINFGSNIYTEGMTITHPVTVNAIKVHNLTASVEAPFSVSLDGTTFAESVALPDEDPIANNTTLYVQYAPTAAGSHTGTLNITNGETTATVALSGSAADCSANIGTLPFTEDFEGSFPPTCWYVVSNNTVTWESNVSQNDNSTWAYCNYAETAQDEKLITKTIDFTTSETAVTMTFDFEASYTYITNADPDEQYNLLIYASTDDGATFSTTPIYDMRNDQGEFEDWTITTATVDLSSLIGETTVKLMFNYYGTYGAEMWVDNINITAGTVGIEEETAENAVSVYPNPASTMLNVHAENFDNVQVINFLGQVVYSANVTENDFQINVSNLSNGVYFIRLNGENTVTKKFVKK